MDQPKHRADGSSEVRTPATFYVPPGSVQPMAGGQNGDTTCRLNAHQLICVSGEVVTTIVPGPCVATVKCLNSGIGTCPTGTPQPCRFKFFQNLCVEVDVSFTADAECNLNPPQCLAVEEGPCPTEQ